MRAMARRLVMLFAIMICVSAGPLGRSRGGILGAQGPRRRSTARARPGTAPRSRRERSWCRKRETNVGVSGGGSVTNSLSAVDEHGRRPPARGDQALGARIGALQLIQALHGAQRHAAHALEQPQAQHCRHGPELADRERRDLLKRADEQIDVARVDPPLGVGDERDRELVDARIARERPAGELRQLAVVAAGEALAHLADVLLDDVEVVEQPLARGSDVHIAVGGGGETRVRVVQNAAGLVQPGEEAGSPPTGAALDQTLAGRHRAGTIREVLGAQQLAADRPAEHLVRGIDATGEDAGEEGRRRCGSDGRASEGDIRRDVRRARGPGSSPPPRRPRPGVKVTGRAGRWVALDQRSGQVGDRAILDSPIDDALGELATAPDRRRFRGIGAAAAEGP